jgi:hypothetical protein
MFALIVFFALLIAISSAALAQGPNKTVQENPCDQVDFTKKWQCESDRLQADRDRKRAGTPEEKLRLSCQQLSQLGLPFKNEAGRLLFVSGNPSRMHFARLVAPRTG